MRTLFRNQRTLASGGLLVGYQSGYDGGFMVKLGPDGPTAGAWGKDEPQVWSELQESGGWQILRELTPEEAALAREMRDEYFNSPACPWRIETDDPETVAGALGVPVDEPGIEGRP